ncbi:MAG TPA: hypothetical protein VE090_04135 [Methylomirabilota bacterium]|nr:hypothetical protein [Methylomirabilota bacterium]
MKIERSVGSQPPRIGTQELRFDAIAAKIMQTELFETTPHPGKFIVAEVNNQNIFVYPKEKTDISFYAAVQKDEDTDLSFVALSIYTRSKNNGYYPGFPRGRILAQEAYKFLAEHNKVDGIAATWVEGEDNYVKYLKEKTNGLSNQQAALRTWTGTNVAKVFDLTQNVTVKPGMVEELVPKFDVRFMK